MARTSSEKRLKALEERVVQLQDEVRSSRDQDKPSWQRAIEKYADDADLLAVLAEGMKLRDAERKKVQEKKGKARKS